MNAVGRDHFDLIFMDIIMPRLDGVSATMYIRQHCPSTPIIAMTSNIRPDEVNGYFEHGKHIPEHRIATHHALTVFG